MRYSIFLIAALFVQGCAEPSPDYLHESSEDTDLRMQWWRDARFGMFIHWGAYANPAGVYNGEPVGSVGEWIMNTAQIPIDEYEEFVADFNPVQYDAEEWVRIAKQAGMKYIIITSKHHDGFGIWDSAVSDYDIADAAAYNQDALKALADAARREGLRFGVYHSIMDWHHPDAQSINYPDYNGGGKLNPDFPRYVENYLKPQVRELIENYDPDVLWFDGEWIPDWTHQMGLDMYNFGRALKPSILINNRVDVGRQGMAGMDRTDMDYAGDFGTPEQEIPGAAVVVDWESCMTMNDTWGFKRNDHNWKSAQSLIHNLVDIVAKGGNFLLNVGPTGQGLIPQPSIDRLAEMGRWMDVNGAAIYGSRAWDHYMDGETVRYTRGAKGQVYAVSLGWPGAELRLTNIEPTPDSEIHLLGHTPALAWTFDNAHGLTIEIPAALQDQSARPGRHAFSFKIQGTARPR